MDAARLRAWHADRQGMNGALNGASAAQVLEQTGWMRTLGGVSPYLGLFARAGISREAADAAIAKLELHKLPAVRGCTYVVPKSDFALALAAGRDFGDAERKVAAKLGVSDREIAKLREAVLKALEKDPLDPDEIRKAVGSAARSLGDEGKKKGLSTTLPLALGELQAAGEIRRVPIDGRLDQKQLKYALWRPNPLAKFKMSAGEVQAEVARRFFAWIGPASLAQFQAFAGLSGKLAKAAAEPHRLEPVDKAGDLLLPAADAAAFRAFQPPKNPIYALVGSLDGITLFRRDLLALADPADARRPLLAGGPGGALHDLPHHAILDRGRLVGLWDYDPAAGEIVWTAFIPPNRDLQQAVARTEAFVREQLGDARAHSQDGPARRGPRLDALRKASRK